MEHFDLLTSFKCRNLKKDLKNITQTMIEKMAYVDHTTTDLKYLVHDCFSKLVHIPMN